MYKIKLSHFEGPLDLLLFFIKRDELNIYDIPISKITKDFMDYLKMLEQLDLEIAGDFILMAATLMQIKVKMLLPKEVDEKGEEIDPRADLVKALLEYKRYKEMSEELSFMESNMRNYNFRGNFEYDSKESATNYETLLRNITIYDLMKAFKKVLLDRVEQPVHQIQKWNVTIEEQMDYISKKLKEKTQITFHELMKEMKNKIRIIVTFIAMLEMVKSGQIGLKESSGFNDFIIYGLNNG
ncbi:MAG: segregation/condensation protein A [Melioribacter sp.]|uniref:segregation and condensation protein A n=1 Tax=Rosettibacter primus TaxID=3111523 RepID=UPI00247BAD0D|nr:segregation/condensation protein A [Melioribacter sp.]